MEGFKQRPDAKSKAYQRFRHRPHANPLSDMEIILPAQRPDQFPFEKFYSMQNTPTKFDCVDIGCGYGDFVVLTCQNLIKTYHSWDLKYEIKLLQSLNNNQQINVQMKTNVITLLFFAVTV
ncbi:TRNA_methyltransferase subunit [Hexamita inflata]|uniref:tRNA methyltransferase subunit n=1 Tax=Hexamita inflata TaxID=28002 RepID=A0AA86PAU4_9EUKA|nr:TRNA methyltransferase subunit [Hexamita inflata]